MGLVDDLIDFIENPSAPERRDELAHRLFQDLREAIPAYGRYAAGCRVDSIAEIPAVPETLYRGGGPRRAGRIVRRFRSSGTSGRTPTVIELSEEGLALMDAAILSGAARRLIVGGEPPRFLLLVPDPGEAPDSIMAYGMDRIGRRHGAGEPRSFVSGGAIDGDALRAALSRAADDGAPVIVAGGSFAVARFLDECAGLGWRVRLPVGSRLLDAGGYKGRSREISAWMLREMVRDALGIPEEDQVNLLGMTELASQFYDRAEAPGAPRDRRVRVKVNEPWTLTRVLDPATGEPTTRIGMLQYVDLAIYDRPCALLTADLGEPAAGGFRFARRSESTSGRGCSLALEGTAPSFRTVEAP